MNTNDTPSFPDKLTPFLIAALFLLIALVSGQLRADDSSTGLTRAESIAHDKLMRKLHACFIKKVDLRNASIQDALRFLYDESKKSDPEHKGIQFVLNAERNTYVPRPITIKLSNVSAEEVLESIRQQSGFAYSVRNYAICVGHDDGEGLTRRTFTNVDGSFVQFKPEMAADGTTQGYDVRAQLRAKGLIFAAGTSALYFPVKKELIVTNDPDQIEVIDELLYAATGAGLHITPGTKFIEIKNYDSSLSP